MEQKAATEDAGRQPEAPSQNLEPALARITGLTTRQEEAEVSISIEATDKIQYTAFKLYNPLRLVLDLPQMEEGVITGPIKIGQGAVSAIQPMYFSEAQVLRLEIELNREVPYKISKPQKNKLLITLMQASRSASERGATDGKTVRLALEKPPAGGPAVQHSDMEDPCDKIFSGDKEKISLDFHRADLRRILQLIAETGGFNLVFAPKVSGTLAMRLIDVPWNRAFSKILKNNGLGRECFDTVVRVATRDDLKREAEVLAKAAVVETTTSDNCQGILLGNKSKISFDFKQANLRNTLRFISEIGGFNLVISPDVKGTLTMKLTDVPWNLALFMILKNTGLAQECSDNIIRIASRSILAQEEKDLLAAERTRAENARLAAEKARQARRFDNELNALKPIPFELYRDIRENDPRLYADLEHYAKLFREKSRLQVMERKSYISLVKFYGQLIDKANGRVASMPQSPLQARKLESMRFVGVLWGGMEPVALIETEDARGHTVKPGTLIGPHFGVVELIEPEKLIIVERARDYLGNITSTTREMELSHESHESHEAQEKS